MIRFAVVGVVAVDGDESGCGDVLGRLLWIDLSLHMLCHSKRWIRGIWRRGRPIDLSARFLHYGFLSMTSTTPQSFIGKTM